MQKLLGELLQLCHLFSDLPDFAALPEPFDPTFVLGLAASTAAIRVSVLSLSEARRVLCVALRWLARRFISLALFVPRISISIQHAFITELRCKPDMLFISRNLTLPLG